MDGAFGPLMAFISSQLPVMALGMLPLKRWQHPQQQTPQEGSAAAQVQTGQSATQTEIPAAYMEDSGLYLQPRHQTVANVRFRTFKRSL
jgi:hypothetical protein